MFACMSNAVGSQVQPGIQELVCQCTKLELVSAALSDPYAGAAGCCITFIPNTSLCNLHPGRLSMFCSDSKCIYKVSPIAKALN